MLPTSLVEETYDALMDYLSARGAVKDPDPLFCGVGNRNRGRLTTRQIRQRVNCYLRKAGIKTDRITTHSLRHTAATLAIEGGADLIAVQQMMRHANISTTRIYVHDFNRVKRGAEHFIKL